METILKNAKSETVDMLIEMIFKKDELQFLTDENRVQAVVERISAICEEVRS